MTKQIHQLRRYVPKWHVHSAGDVANTQTAIWDVYALQTQWDALRRELHSIRDTRDLVDILPSPFALAPAALANWLAISNQRAALYQQAVIAQVPLQSLDLNVTDTSYSRADAKNTTAFALSMLEHKENELAVKNRTTPATRPRGIKTPTRPPGTKKGYTGHLPFPARPAEFQSADLQFVITEHAVRRFVERCARHLTLHQATCWIAHNVQQGAFLRERANSGNPMLKVAAEGLRAVFVVRRDTKGSVVLLTCYPDAKESQEVLDPWE